MSNLLDDDEIILQSPDSIITSSIGYSPRSLSTNVDISGTSLNYSVGGDKSSFPPTSPQLTNTIESPTLTTSSTVSNITNTIEPPTLLTTTTTSPTITTTLSSSNPGTPKKIRDIPPPPPLPTVVTPSPYSNDPTKISTSSKNDKDNINNTFVTLITEENQLSSEEKEIFKNQKNTLISALPEVPTLISPSPTLGRNAYRNSGTWNKPPLSPQNISPSGSLNNSSNNIHNGSISPVGSASANTLQILSQLNQSRSLPTSPHYITSPTMPALNKQNTASIFGSYKAQQQQQQPQVLYQTGSPLSSGITSPLQQSPNSQSPVTYQRNHSQSLITPLNLNSDSTMGPSSGSNSPSISKKEKKQQQQQQQQPQVSFNPGATTRSPNLMSSTQRSSGVMGFLGKMSLSKERMSKLVTQTKETYKTPGNSNPTSPTSTLVPFEGIFGIPLRVILRYPNESGNQIPSILNNIFSILESSSALSTNKLFYGANGDFSPSSTSVPTQTNVTSLPTSPNLSSSSGSSGSASPNLSTISSLSNSSLNDPNGKNSITSQSTISYSPTNSSHHHQNISHKSIKQEVEHICNLYDQGNDVSLKNYSIHVITEVFLEFFNRLPEPIISVEFYETLLNYYQTETLLHLMIRKMNNPNKSILCRLMKYLKDVMVYTNFNDATLELLVERFHKYILRPSIGAAQSCTISESHTKTIKDIVSMFILQADVLFQPPEERMNSDDSQILYIEEVLSSQKSSNNTSLNGNLWLFHKQIVWRPKVNTEGEPDLQILFSSILKIVLAPAPTRKEQQKTLPNFTIYCSSETKTVITFYFQNPSTCKLVFAFIHSVIKSISQLNRIIPQKLDMFSLELENLPNEIKQLKELQELNLNRNKFKLMPGDLARLTSLRTICIEENNLTEISSEMADFLGTRLGNLENVSLSSNRLVVLPPLYTWLKLKTLNISNNYLTKLPVDIFQIPTLEVLRVSNNQIDDNGIPKICTSTRLRSLDLRKNHLTTIPEGIFNLIELQVLTLQDNQIQQLTSDIQKLTSLTELNLNGNQISSLPPQLLLLTNLKKLYLDNNQLQSISSAIHRMQSLIELRLTNNNISRLPPGIVALKKLNSLELTGNKPLKDNIPEKYILKGKEGIFSYFSETMRTNVPCYRTRIIMLGDKGSGKSNLVKCLKKVPTKPNTSLSHNASGTNVLDIQDWSCQISVDGPDGKKKKTITIHLWEFEGIQNDISHVFFVSNIVYSICFDLSKFGTKQNDHKITSYLYGIYQHDRKATILMIGTHLDEVGSKKHVDKTFELLMAKYKTLFPSLNLIFHAVNTMKHDSDGIRKLRREIKAMISKNPILKQTYPASFMYLEDYLKEESNLMSPPLVTKKTLQQMARTMELHNEPHFTQLKSLFNSLGSIASFEQFIRMEPGSTPTKTEMIALNPIWIAKAIASLVCFNPQNLPFNVSVGSEEAIDAQSSTTIAGILPHRVLRYVWGTNSQYYVPERFFSLFLSLLESNDLAINIYSIEQNNHHGSFGDRRNSRLESFSAIGNDSLSPQMLGVNTNLNNRRYSISLNNLTSFSTNQKVRYGRSSSFNARSGWALVSSLLSPYNNGNPIVTSGQSSIKSNSSVQSVQLSLSPIIDLPGVWEAFPEAPEIQQFTRKFVLDVIPVGLFGRLLSRLMQHAHLQKCWKDLAILVPEIDGNAASASNIIQSLTPVQKQFKQERILVNVDHDCNSIEISLRFIKCSSLLSEIYNIFDSLVTKWYKVGYKTFITCSHCIEKKNVSPYLFKLEECEAMLFKGETELYCQHKSGVNEATSSPISSSRSNSKLSRKDSKSNFVINENGSSSPTLSKKDHHKEKDHHHKDSKEKDTKHHHSHHHKKDKELQKDLSTPVLIRNLLLDHHTVCNFIKEIDFKEIEVLPDHSSQSENGSTSQSMGMYGSQFVNVKVFNQPLPGCDFYSNCAKVLSNFRHEALSLYNFRHTNVLSIIGVSFNPVAIITENPTFGNKGSTTLTEYIQDRQKHPEIPWNIKLKIALDIARALEKLNSHSPPFLLTNFTSNSIILEKSNNSSSSSSSDDCGVIAKITDFSSSSFLPSLFPTSNTAKPHHAPEVLQKLNYHEYTDVYSFGIILFELLTRSIAFQDHERFGNMVVNGQRPSIPPDCLPSFADLIKDCWSGEPLNRPSPSKIIQQLLQIKKEIESKEHNYKSLASDNNIYSDQPLPSGGSIIYQDKIIHFGGWNGSSKPHSNVYSLNLSSMLFEDKLMVVINDKGSPTYKAFYQHMQSEFCEENLIFYEAIKTFKNLPNQTPDDREIIKIQSKKIFQVFIGETAQKEINLPFLLKKELKKKIEAPEGPSVTVFNDTLSFVISSIEDSFHRFKFSTPSNSKNGWVLIDCKGQAPPPMVGHSSILWNNNLVIIGGWFNRARVLNQCFMLNLDSFEWQNFSTSGDVPPSSTAALNITLHGDYLLAYYESRGESKTSIYRLNLESMVWFSLNLKPN
ncbi:roco10, ROCO family protein [Dictyostelium purpureum]|uniref:Roco10, ROCO family protein n=1 Tax=Dictyostelium purpureum TaxID=5786 RepID=F0ZBR8_DICPU|nr:roco10, ROCO family protein [Dictyostelium purpureum]EGC38606.1 roco10, ROCO family protein [Dictyostelium purpureum]|eukprot:XP_003284885.1 roco10, ROCO family protein [Dictyostelium purpureum]